MSISSNNISVPTINYALSGSVSRPITQGAFQSSLSTLTAENPPPYPGQSYLDASAYGSHHVYLKLNLGTVNEFNGINATSIRQPEGYTGIYCKGTVLKPGSATIDAWNLQHGIVFEHFGVFRYPVGTSIEHTAGNLYSEFVLKSQTWHVDDYQANSNLGPSIGNSGMETAYNWNYGAAGDGLKYALAAHGYGQGRGAEYNEQNSIFPMYTTVPDYEQGQGDSVNGDKSVFLNCAINFYGETQASVQGFLVKGTYLLL